MFLTFLRLGFYQASQVMMSLNRHITDICRFDIEQVACYIVLLILVPNKTMCLHLTHKKKKDYIDKENTNTTQTSFKFYHFNTNIYQLEEVCIP